MLDSVVLLFTDEINSHTIKRTQTRTHTRTETCVVSYEFTRNGIASINRQHRNNMKRKNEHTQKKTKLIKSGLPKPNRKQEKVEKTGNVKNDVENIYFVRVRFVFLLVLSFST